MKAKALMASTHPSEYLLHKYWARKPSNILKEYIKTYFKKGDVVIDPFCGSGVFLAEAKQQHLNATGYDLNPIAHLLSEVTCNPPSSKEFLAEASKFLQFAEKYRSLFKIGDKEIRYLVHEVESECPGCGQVGSISNTKKTGNKYLCRYCGERMSFNFEKFKGTRIVKVYDRDNIEYSDKEYIDDQLKKATRQYPSSRFDFELLVNRRILAFPGMRLSDLFTPRTFYIFNELFEYAHKVEEEPTRQALLLLLTSSVAQSSRLIPHRNNLSTGGPAWTVPGFWIAPLHLETNPIIHLEARLKKFEKGLEALGSNYRSSKGSATIKNTSAQKGLESLKDSSINGIFFDPPYGDNVPYAEFSAIWNGFLRKKVDYSNEVIVSDRKEFRSSWEKYEKDMESMISLFFKKLKKGGRIVMTFNNLDPRAWKIVLGSFAKFSFICIDAKYQIPAVISSKSQMASNTSYIGDYYCVFEKTTKKLSPNHNLFHLTNAARQVLQSRGGKAPKNLVHRMFILTILNENMDLNLLNRFAEILKPIATEDKEYYYLREDLFTAEKNSVPNISVLLESTAQQQLKDGRKTIQDFYEAILDTTDKIGSPLLSEVREILKGKVFFDKDYCYLQNTSANKTLFES